MNRIIRMRRYNSQSTSGNQFDTLFPQTITSNILRSEDGGVLESYLFQYDRHLVNETVHINRALSDGNARALSVVIKDRALVDDFPLMLTLHTNLECEPTLSFNGGEPYPILSANGERIPGGQAEGSVIFLVWKQALMGWVLVSANNFNDVTKVVLPVEHEYVYTASEDGEEVFVVPGFNKKADKITINYGQTILRQGVDYDFVKNSNDSIHLGFGLSKGDLLYCTITTFIITAKRGHYRYELKAKDYQVAATRVGQKTFKLPEAASGAHSVVVNYNQTILRNNLDYDYTNDGGSIKLRDFALDTGDSLVFTITEFVEAPGELVPNNWGATGNYRYALNVVHAEYKATEDNITIITVPGYNYRRDHINVIRRNKLFIYDVDYTIDEIGNVVLLKEVLNTGDKIYFTILQGAMMDVPNFNVLQAHGWDGQHILLDMSYSQLSDFHTVLVRLRHDLKTAPIIKCVDGPAEPVCDCFHMPIRGGYKAGAYLWLVYSQHEKMWYSLSHSQIDISTLIPNHKIASGEGEFSGGKIDPATGEYIETMIEHGLGVRPERIEVRPCEPPSRAPGGSVTTIGDIWTHADDTYLYVGNTGESVSRFTWTVSTEDATNDLRSYIDQVVEDLKQKAKANNIMVHLSTYTAMEDDVTEITDIDNYDKHHDTLIVNYGQTILRQGVDYEIIEPNGIRLINGIKLMNDEILQFTVLKQKDGHSFDTRMWKYTADEDGIRQIKHIKDFRAHIDKIIVNFNQTVLRENIDFRVLNPDRIQLIGFSLAKGDTLQFTILRKATIYND